MPGSGRRGDTLRSVIRTPATSYSRRKRVEERRDLACREGRRERVRPASARRSVSATGDPGYGALTPAFRMADSIRGDRSPRNSLSCSVRSARHEEHDDCHEPERDHAHHDGHDEPRALLAAAPVVRRWRRRAVLRAAAVGRQAVRVAGPLGGLRSRAQGVLLPVSARSLLEAYPKLRHAGQATPRRRQPPPARHGGTVVHFADIALAARIEGLGAGASARSSRRTASGSPSWARHRSKSPAGSRPSWSSGSPVNGAVGLGAATARCTPRRLACVDRFFRDRGERPADRAHAVRGPVAHEAARAPRLDGERLRERARARARPRRGVRPATCRRRGPPRANRATNASCGRPSSPTGSRRPKTRRRPSCGWGRLRSPCPDGRFFIGYVDGQPAGTGELHLRRRHRVAHRRHDAAAVPPPRRAGGAAARSARARARRRMRAGDHRGVARLGEPAQHGAARISASCTRAWKRSHPSTPTKGTSLMATRNETNIAFVGTGVMGLSMAGHLLDAGYPLVVFNRTAEKAAPLLERGARWAESAGAAAADADVVITMVGYPVDVEEIYLAPRRHRRARATDAVLVDMTTSSPALAERVAKAAAAAGHRGARRARLRRRHRREERDADDHGRRRCRGVRAGRAGAARDGRQRGPPGRAGRRPAYEDGEPGGDRRLDARDGGVARLCRACRARSAPRARLDRRRFRGELVARQPRAAHSRRQLRAGLLREALREGHAHRTRCRRRDGARPAGARYREAALRAPRVATAARTSGRRRCGCSTRPTPPASAPGSTRAPVPRQRTGA